MTFSAALLWDTCPDCPAFRLSLRVLLSAHTSKPLEKDRQHDLKEVSMSNKTACFHSHNPKDIHQESRLSVMTFSVLALHFTAMCMHTMARCIYTTNRVFRKWCPCLGGELFEKRIRRLNEAITCIINDRSEWFVGLRLLVLKWSLGKLKSYVQSFHFGP